MGPATNSNLTKNGAQWASLQMQKAMRNHPTSTHWPKIVVESLAPNGRNLAASQGPGPFGLPSHRLLQPIKRSLARGQLGRARSLLQKLQQNIGSKHNGSAVPILVVGSNLLWSYLAVAQDHLPEAVAYSETAVEKARQLDALEGVKAALLWQAKVLLLTHQYEPLKNLLPQLAQKQLRPAQKMLLYYLQARTAWVEEHFDRAHPLFERAAQQLKCLNELDLFSLDSALDLLLMAHKIQWPDRTELLGLLQQSVPADWSYSHGRLQWLQVLDKYHEGRDYAGNLRQFLKLCEDQGLFGLIRRALRPFPGPIMSGLGRGIISPLYTAVLPRLGQEELRSLLQVTVNPGQPASLRQTAFQLLARQPGEPYAHEAACFLAASHESPLKEIGQRYLVQTRSRHLIEGRHAFEFRSLGAFGLLYKGQSIARGLRLKARILFTMLMLRDGQPLLRAHVQDMLWPDLPSTAAANNLRVTLHSLRKALINTAAGEGNDSSAETKGEKKLQLVTSGNNLALVGTDCITWDAKEMEQSVQTARHCLQLGQKTLAAASLRRAVELYGGDFLPTADFQEHFIAEQRHYHRLAHEALIQLARIYIEQREAEDAVAMAERATFMEPLDEVGHALLMRAHAAAHNIQRVVDSYEDYANIMQHELKRGPSGKMRSLLTELTS